jgi:hypothetical protein
MAQGGRGVVGPGCEHCKKKLYTTSQFVEHLAVDVLPHILDVALSTPTKFVYCPNCKRSVEYENPVLETDRYGLRNCLRSMPFGDLHIS